MPHRPALILAALFPLWLGGCGAEPVAAPEAAAPTFSPQTAVAEAVSEAALATVPATVILPAGARVAVTAPFPGAARQVHVIEGQQVKAGQLLATVVSRDALSLAADRARADARLDLARANAARMRQLAAEGVVAGARADEAAAGLRVAEADRAEAARLLSRGGASGDGIVRLLAPIAGRVSHVAVETGGPIDGMTAPFVIDASDRYALELQLPERLAGRVKPGMAVELEGGGRGTILAVTPGLDPETRSIRAIARVGALPGLLAGASLTVTLVADVAEAVAVPSAAVTRQDGREIVFVKGKEGFRPVPVVVGASAGGRTTLLQGVAPGAVVAVSNLPELKSMAAG